MVMTTNKQEKTRNVRYRIQVKPGKTRLIAEFDKNQTELLGKFIDLLVPDDNREKQHEGKRINSGGQGFAIVTRE